MQKTTTQADFSAFKKCLLLELEISCFGVTRKVSTKDVIRARGGDADSVDSDAVGSHKTLLFSEEYKAIKSYLSDLYRWVKRNSLPSLFKKGIYVVPAGLVERIEADLERSSNPSANPDDAWELPELVQDLEDNWEASVEQARKKLEPMGVFRASDYPLKERVKDHFGIRWQWMSIPDADSLKTVDINLWKRESAKQREQLVEYINGLKALFADEMIKFVDEMIERLKPGPDGKRKTFKDSSIKRFKEYLDLFEERDITGDPRMRDIVKKAKRIMDGVDGEILREYDRTRQEISKSFTDLREEMGKMVEIAPSRTIDLESEVV